LNDGENISRGQTVLDGINRVRIPLSVDPLGDAGQVLSDTLLDSRIQAVSHLYLSMGEIHNSLGQLVTSLAAPTAPPQLIGVLVQPDGTSAGYMQVQFDPSTLNNNSSKVIVRTDAFGAFQLALPPGLLLPSGSNITLMIHGANSNVWVEIPSSQIASNGLIGNIMLPQFLESLPLSILGALQALTTPLQNTSTPPAPTPIKTTQLASVTLGEGDSNLLSYIANSTVDRFPFGVFYRLVEPRASIMSQVRVRVNNRDRYIYLPDYATKANVIIERPTGWEVESTGVGGGARGNVAPAEPGNEPVSYVDRVPIEQPISVDGFRDQMMGLLENGYYTGDETRPMAGTLGLGYVLWMSQHWTFQGLALGDLVYSLPLAPGEQQQVAIFERTDVSQVTESEFFTEEQAEQQRALADTSAQATFRSAFNESIHGTSSFQSLSASASWGFASIIASGGAGVSASTGSSEQTLEGQRNTSQQAAQTTHSAAENQAYARRSAARTGMRLASASESQQVTTRVITNHNHTRALTMQYWDVQRLYDVTTGIDGLQLVVLVPLQLVRFMPPYQPATLSDESMVSDRSQVLARYRQIIKHGDVLLQALPRQYRRGLEVLLQFAADPTAQVEGSGSPAEDVINFGLTGTFIANEDIYITAVTDRGTRVGPVKLSNSAPTIPTNTFSTQEELVEWLVSERQGAPGVTFQGALALPTTMNRTNIVGFEISRGFRQIAYTLVSPVSAELSSLTSIFGVNNPLFSQALQSVTPNSMTRRTIFLNPSDLESLIGGPSVYGFSAAIEELDEFGNSLPSPNNEQYANESLQGIELPSQPYPIPARQLGPVLRYKDILEIEKMAQHIARQTLTYSHAIWASMTPDERAILLEAYTIGVPPGGVADATQMIPLLNCVENRVLGFYGNSMMMPFIIPEALAQAGTQDGDRDTLHPAKIQGALLAFHARGFQPPHSTIALPTRGVLGEAVLGHSVSAEKIDITRFWNWQDSPADTAPIISPVTLPTSSPALTAGVTAPNSLTNLPSLINNVLTAPSPDTSLLQALSKAAASQQDFSTSLTGAEQLAGLIRNAQNTAESARGDALKTTKDLHAQAMATVGNILGAIYAGDPTAGSDAASSVYGTSGTNRGGAGNQAQNQGQNRGNTQGGGNAKTGGTGGAPGGGTSTGGPGGGPTGGAGTGTGTGGTGTGGPGGGPAGGTGTGTGTSSGTAGPAPAPGPPS
jgi:hypothetical protein